MQVHHLHEHLHVTLPAAVKLQLPVSMQDCEEVTCCYTLQWPVSDRDHVTGMFPCRL